MASISKITTPDGNSYDLKAKFDLDGNEIKTSYIKTNQKGAASGVAELDSNGKVPTSQLPSYVDDVLEYANKESFPATGETGKIYVDKDKNLTYRWSGTAYVEISPSLALGTTSSTAFRGDYGNIAYVHATDSSKISSSKTSGLYKIAVTDEGHIASADAVQKSDITDLGIPGSAPTATSELTNDSGFITYAAIPTNVSAFANDAGYITSAAIPTATSDLTNDSGFITSEDIPTAVSSFTNDAGYITSDAIPTNVSEFTNDAGYQTESQVSTAISAEAGKLIPYGYCEIAAGTVAKTVTVSPAITELKAGITIAVKFEYANTSSNPTLNVNGLGAKSIKRYGTTAAGTSAASNWNANAVVMLTYDGTYWMLNDWNNTTYSGMTDAEYQAGTGTSNRLITPARLKAAILHHAPVSSVNGNTGDVTIDVPTKTSDLENDSGFITTANVPTPASSNPVMDGTAAVGTSAKYAREDHVHPSDTSRVPTSRKVNGHALTSDVDITASDVGAVPDTRTVNGHALNDDITITISDVGGVPSTRTVNGHALSSDVDITASDVGAVPTGRKINGKTLNADISLTASDVSAIPSSQKGAASGVAELDSSGKVPTSQLPSYVDDVLEYASKSAFPTTGESGKIYVDKATNLTYRWSGTAYVEISPSLALGETSSTAYRGDYGAAAYAHAVTNKGSAFASGLYKITTNSEGHVTAATAVQKSDITGLGIPGTDTNTTYTAQTTSIGSASAGTAISADDITDWTTNTATSASVIAGVFKITTGTAASLSYTSRSIPNISVTAKTVATGITADS